MEFDKDKFASGKVFFGVFVTLLMVSPVLFVMYFSGHKDFVMSAMIWSFLVVLIGPVLNGTKIHNAVIEWFRRREEKK